MSQAQDRKFKTAQGDRRCNYRYATPKNLSAAAAVQAASVGMALKGTFAFLWSAGRSRRPRPPSHPPTHPRWCSRTRSLHFRACFGVPPLPLPPSESHSAQRGREGKGERGLPCHGLIDAPACLPALHGCAIPSLLPSFRIGLCSSVSLTNDSIWDQRQLQSRSTPNPIRK